jgi:rhamnogalacturonan endolyase
MRRAALILLGLCLGCDSRSLVVITPVAPTPDASGPLDASGPTGGTNGHFHMEKLDRGLVAVSMPDGSGVYLSWRMFGNEYDDQHPERFAYAINRDGAKIATVTDSTNYFDEDGSPDVEYQVAFVIDTEVQEFSRVVTAWPNNQNYLRIPLQVPPPGVTPATCSTNPNQPYTYSANDASVGDLDGDGRYEIVLKWDPSNSQDNIHPGCTGNVLLDAYTLDGKQLWRIDLGPNIRAGAHYTQHLVYDFDGDGVSEVVVKTAPGTLDGTGTYLQTGPAADDDDTAVYRNSTGYILTGPEYLTVFDGPTGAELATVDFQPARGAVTDWGDSIGNNADNYLSTAAFVRDQNPGDPASGRPSIIMARGLYSRAAISAWNWRDGALTLLWIADSAQNTMYANQGAHSMMVADTDGDGAQEIIWGSATISGDGKKQCTTGFGHGDALHVGVLLFPPPSAIQVFMPHETGTQPAYDVHDASTCHVIVKGPVLGIDNGRGVADDIDPNNAGAEMWSGASTSLLSATDGSIVGKAPSSTNFVIYWDADELREIEDGTSITKYGGGTLLSCSACSSNNGTKSTPALTADLLGDWREEIIWRESDNSALRLYTTTDVTTHRIYTLMHDPQYRMQVSAEQTGFNQPPHPGFFLGYNMPMPPKPDIFIRPVLGRTPSAP